MRRTSSARLKADQGHQPRKALTAVAGAVALGFILAVVTVSAMLAIMGPLLSLLGIEAETVTRHVKRRPSFGHHAPWVWCS